MSPYNQRVISSLSMTATLESKVSVDYMVIVHKPFIVYILIVYVLFAPKTEADSEPPAVMRPPIDYEWEDVASQVRTKNRSSAIIPPLMLISRTPIFISPTICSPASIGLWLLPSRNRCIRWRS